MTQRNWTDLGEGEFVRKSHGNVYNACIIGFPIEGKNGRVIFGNVNVKPEYVSEGYAVEEVVVGLLVDAVRIASPSLQTIPYTTEEELNSILAKHNVIQ